MRPDDLCKIRREGRDLVKKIRKIATEKGYQDILDLTEEALTIVERARKRINKRIPQKEDRDKE